MSIITEGGFRVALGLFLLSLLIKLLYVSGIDIVNSDGIRYFNSAHKLFEGDISSAFYHEKMLFYTFVLGLVNLIVGDWVLAGQLISVTFLALAIFPLYSLTNEMFGALPAFWASLAFMLAPSINDIAGLVVKDAPFIFFILSAVWFGYIATVRQQKTYFLMTFICAAIAALFRFEALVFIGFYPVWIAVQFFFRSSNRNYLAQGLLFYVAIPAFSLCCAGILLLMGFFEWSQLGAYWERFNSHYFGVNLWENYNSIYSHLKTVEKNFPGGIWTNDFFEIARYNLPLIYLIGVLQLLFKVMYPAYVLPFCLGISMSEFKKRNHAMIIAVALAYFLAIYLYMFSRNFLSSRYVVIITVLLLPFVGYGFERIIAYSRASRHRILLFSIIFIVFIVLPLHKVFKSTVNERNELRVAGIWLDDTLDLSKNHIITNDERIPFYAGSYRESYSYFYEFMNIDLNKYLSKNNETIIAYVYNNNTSDNYKFDNKYDLIKSFDGVKSSVYIYKYTK